jgi:glycosyltransferase involved in cell wall biosynthesis
MVVESSSLEKFNSKNMYTPQISVIMAVYNTEKYVEDAIHSILDQTLSNLELIIIDDMSTDRSPSIIQKLDDKDTRIIFIQNDNNIGPASSRNRGLDLAKGKYIAILDSDDIANKERLSMQVKYLEQNPEVFLVGSMAQYLGEDNTAHGVFSTGVFNPDKFKKILPKRNCFIHSSVTFRNNGKYRYREKFRYSEDYDLFIRMMSEGKGMANINRCLVSYRINLKSISWTESSKLALFAKKAKEFYRERLQTGQDGYELFDPNEILDLDVDSSTDLFVLFSETKAAFKSRQYEKSITIAKKGFKHHGFLNKITLYYCLSLIKKYF